jgi:hypothetical protein
MENSNKVNKFGEIEEKKKNNFEDKNDNPSDSIKKIEYVKDLVNKTLKDIENFEKKENDINQNIIIEENKENIINNKYNDNNTINRNNYSKRFIYKTKKIEELTKINELLIILKETNNLNYGINKLNSIIDELNEKGHKLPKFEKNKMEVFFPITYMDKAEYKKNSSGEKMISITLNYSLLDD